ncbi:hypothetical protein AVEN_66450-1 [Araneus ventricosus]|uniref:Uncharacterized protein n=1 Tax=Araneus ventricosus TaxID=182803 RepID=A0A4Y2VNF4_ARAVE|nr:hypothetical protein AVEN_66450-1 [Araneus ventricosus]
MDAMSKRLVVKPRYERSNVTSISTPNEEDLSDLINAINNAANQDPQLADHRLDVEKKTNSFDLRGRTPMFSERNPILRTPCGKLLEAIGRCILRVDKNAMVQHLKLLVFQQCSHDLILGLHCFKETDAIIECWSGKLQIGSLE